MQNASQPRIGRYRIVKPLGRGTMGVVYLAEDPALERLVALKTIDLALAVPEPERDAFQNRFVVEARVAAKLSHPGIVVVHDVGRDADSGILFIALEYLPGQTLDDLMAGGHPLDWREALRITAKVARALYHAHTHAIVHRDVKPANIMLLPSGETKIMDFGIAKVPEVQLTAAGQFFGTPLYMSPEQALGEPLDARSDLFSLGAITYLLLTGRPAFKAGNMMEVLARVVHDVPTPPSRLVPTLTEEVDELVARALAKDPEDRYPDGESLARDAENLIAGRPLAEAAWLEELGLLEAVDSGSPADATVRSGSKPTRVPTPAAMAAPALPAPPPTEDAPSLPATQRRLDVPVAATALPLLETKPRLRSWRLSPLLIALAGVALGLVILVALLRAPASQPKAWVLEPASREAGPRIALASPSPRSPPEKGAASAESGEATPPDDPGPVPPNLCRVSIDFEHHLKSGTLRIFVDDDPVLEEALDSRVAKRILSLRLRKGSVDETLALRPGKHEIRVQVSWQGKWKSRRITSTFEGGTSRTLRIRVSRLFGDLSLELR